MIKHRGCINTSTMQFYFFHNYHQWRTQGSRLQRLVIAIVWKDFDLGMFFFSNLLRLWTNKKRKVSGAARLQYNNGESSLQTKKSIYGGKNNWRNKFGIHQFDINHKNKSTFEEGLLVFCVCLLKSWRDHYSYLPPGGCQINLDSVSH